MPGPRGASRSPRHGIRSFSRIHPMPVRSPIRKPLLQSLNQGSYPGFPDISVRNRSKGLPKLPNAFVRRLLVCVRFHSSIPICRAMPGPRPRFPMKRGGIRSLSAQNGYCPAGNLVRVPESLPDPPSSPLRQGSPVRHAGRPGISEAMHVKRFLPVKEGHFIEDSDADRLPLPFRPVVPDIGGNLRFRPLPNAVPVRVGKVSIRLDGKGPPVPGLHPTNLVSVAVYADAVLGHGI